VDDARSTLERWRETTFDMVEVSPGQWGWGHYVKRNDEVIDKHTNSSGSGTVEQVRAPYQ
jgi:hypothetical protein